MSVHKNIFWREDLGKTAEGQTANVHLLIGYCPDTIEYFNQMAAQLRETFPQAKDSELHCGQVRHSNYCKGFTILSWTGVIPKGDYPGWNQHIVKYSAPEGDPNRRIEGGPEYGF